MSRPGAVALFALCGLGVTLAADDPVVHVLVLAVAWIVLVRRRTADRRLRPLVIGLVLLGVVTTAINGLLAHTGTNLWATVPSWVPLFGGTITAEGFAQGGVIALSLLAAVSVAATLSVVLDPADLVDALPHPLERTGAALGAALNLVPATAASVVAVRDAQRLRGWRPRGPRDMVDLAVPVILGAIERSTQLAESMEARGFGSGPRTRSSGTGRTSRNAAVAALAVSALAALVAGRLAGDSGSWAAYPTPTMPSFDPFVLAPSILLGLAAFLVPGEDGLDRT